MIQSKGMKMSDYVEVETRWDLQDLERRMNDFQVITIPDEGKWEDENDWFYKKFDVVLRIACFDGTFLIVIQKKI